MGPGGVFPISPDLADILGRTDLDVEDFYFFDFSDPKFPDFQVPDFQISRNLAWASLGPGLGTGLGRASGSIEQLCIVVAATISSLSLAPIGSIYP